MYGRIAAVHDANPYEDPPSAFPDDPAYRWAGERVARLDVGLRAGVHARLGADRSRRGRVARRGGVDLQGARRARRVRERSCWRRGSPRGPRSRPRSSVGTRCSRCISRAAATTTRGSARCVLAALATQAARRAALGARRCREVGPARAAPAAGARVAPAGRGSVRSPSRRLSSPRSRRGATASRGSTRSARSPTTRGRRRATRCRTGSRSSAFPKALRSRSSPRSSRSSTSCSRARRGAVARGSALASVALLACAPYVTPWYLAWVVPLAAVEEDKLARGLALAFTAYLLPQTIPV